MICSINLSPFLKRISSKISKTNPAAQWRRLYKLRKNSISVIPRAEFPEESAFFAIDEKNRFLASLGMTKNLFFPQAVPPVGFKSRQQ